MAQVGGPRGGPRVLVVDDDPQVRDLLRAALVLAGMDVTAAGSAQECLTALAAHPPDVVLLDLGLPDLDGLEVVRLTASSPARVPVIAVTARDDLDDKLAGLRAGAADYVTKPFHVSEVVARIEAVLRRPSRDADADVVVVEDLVIDTAALTVHRAGVEVVLTPTEYALLCHLARNAGRVLSKAQLLDAVWEYDFAGDGGVVERFVSNLRRKVDDGRTPLIATVRGFGYRLGPPRRTVGRP